MNPLPPDWLPYHLNVPLVILSIFALAAFIVFGIPAIIRAIRN